MDFAQPRVSTIDTPVLYLQHHVLQKLYGELAHECPCCGKCSSAGRFAAAGSSSTGCVSQKGAARPGYDDLVLKFLNKFEINHISEDYFRFCGKECTQYQDF